MPQQQTVEFPFTSSRGAGSAPATPVYSIRSDNNGRRFMLTKYLTTATAGDLFVPDKSGTQLGHTAATGNALFGHVCQATANHNGYGWVQVGGVGLHAVTTDGNVAAQGVLKVSAGVVLPIGAGTATANRQWGQAFAADTSTSLAAGDYIIFGGRY